jgi:hypothetical protein
MNPNVKVIETARDAFPKDHYMYGALDHAAAELAVLHLRCQRTALTPPEGYVLVPVDSVKQCACGCHRYCCVHCGTELGGTPAPRN